MTETSRSLLDVILVNNDRRITDSGVVPVPLSDHYLVYCILKSGVIKAPPQTIEYCSYKNFNMNTFLADLNSVPWHVIENEEDIDDAVFIWNQLFSEIADLHVPVKRPRVQGVLLPWLNDKISETMKDRDFHYHKAVKTNSDFHWACPQCIVVEGIEYTTAASISSELNCYFASIGRSLANNISAAAVFLIRSPMKLVFLASPS